MKILKLNHINRSKNQLSYQYSLDGIHFSTSFWYSDINFFELEEKYGEQFLQNLYFHIGLFDINKVCSLRPDFLDISEFSEFNTAAIQNLWYKIFKGVWGQWRYENNDPDYLGPRMPQASTSSTANPQTIISEQNSVLAFCGGGKDTLVALKLLDRAGIPYSGLSYSHSIYGQSEFQHELVESLVSKTGCPKTHRLYMFDDFMDSPICQLRPDLACKTLFAAETPSSIFASLPYALTYGYTSFSLGHEKSADKGQLIWNGEEINHQWGKSFEAESLLNNYIQETLLNNFDFCSLLKPIHDVLIFNLLRWDLDILPFAHSCNIQKPWCMKCAKCFYVWVNYMAYLPTDLVNSIFQTNLFDIPENKVTLEHFLGLHEHLPFECIGHQNEMIIALELCYLKGLKGDGLSFFKSTMPNVNLQELSTDYVKHHMDKANLPEYISQKIYPLFEKVQSESQDYIEQFTHHSITNLRQKRAF